MSDYDALRDYLIQQTSQEIELGFWEIEEIIGRRLPPSADRSQWWANEVDPYHPQREAWRAAGFDAFLVAGSRKVRFRRAQAGPSSFQTSGQDAPQ